MKRKGAKKRTRFSEQAYQDEMIFARQGSNQLSCGNYRDGYLFDSIGVLNALPVEPQAMSEFNGPTALSVASSEGPSATCNSLLVTNIFEFADPCRQFEFSVISTQSSTCWEEVSRNLYIAAVLAGGNAIPAVVSLHASSSFNVIPDVDSLRVTISPAWWSRATSFEIVGLYHAGQLVATPLLPATVKVMNVNHTPSKEGRLSKSINAGDLAGVIAALKNGCSTEETNKKVSIMYQGRYHSSNSFNLFTAFRARHP